MTRPAPRPGLLDVVEGAALTLATVMIAALPPITSEFAVPQPAVAVVAGLGVLGALGIIGAFIVGSARSRRVLPAGVVLLLGVAIWVVAVVYLDPLLGWRTGLATAWLASALLVAIAWFVLRSFPARAYPALLAIAAGAVLASVAPAYPLVLVGLAGGAAVAYVVALLVLRAGAPRRQASAAL